MPETFPKKVEKSLASGEAFNAIIELLKGLESTEPSTTELKQAKEEIDRLSSIVVGDSQLLKELQNLGPRIKELFAGVEETEEE